MDIRATPPGNAILLFSGQFISDWLRRDGRPPAWKMEGGFLEVTPGMGDIVTRQRFNDFFLHLEFRCPESSDPRRHDRANSGVFLQGRYEIQILDSWGVQDPGAEDCGAIYGQAPPLVNASKPAMAWQKFEVIFRAPRPAAEGNIEPARATVMHNGLVVHNNLSLRPTPGAFDQDLLAPGPLILQEHGWPVGFRRGWIVPLRGGNEPS
jgi:hypothetical protein